MCHSLNLRYAFFMLWIQVRQSCKCNFQNNVCIFDETVYALFKKMHVFLMKLQMHFSDKRMHFWTNCICTLATEINAFCIKLHIYNMWTLFWCVRACQLMWALQCDIPLWCSFTNIGSVVILYKSVNVNIFSEANILCSSLRTSF